MKNYALHVSIILIIACLLSIVFKISPWLIIPATLGASCFEVYRLYKKVKNDH